MIDLLHCRGGLPLPILALFALVMGWLALGLAWQIHCFRQKLRGDALNQANTLELERRDHQKSLCMRIAAHDLRSPLTTLFLTTDLLKHSSEPDQQQKTLAQMEIALMEMEDLVHRMLNQDALESGHLFRQIEIVEFGQIVNEVATRYDLIAKAKKITFVTRICETQPLGYADRTLLKQSLGNLVSNAIKYSPQGATIDLGVQRTGAFLRCYVLDQGPGLTKSDREILFTGYRPMSARPTNGESSKGLGLSLTKSMVEFMDGRIGIEDQTCGGSCFWIELAAVSSAMDLVSNVRQAS